jgi:hypothetical protein
MLVYFHLCRRLELHYSCRQLFANAAIATSKRRLVAVRRPAVLVLAKGERPQPWLADRWAAPFMIRPTTTPSQTTSKSSSFHSPDGREVEARLRAR